VTIDVGVLFIDIEIICSDKTEHKTRTEKGISTIPGLKLPTWQQGQGRDYHPRYDNRIVINTSLSIQVAEL